MSNRMLVLVLDIVYVGVLLLLAAVYFTEELPEIPVLGWLRAPATYGDIPSGVLWFGALGGVLISLVGVHEHRHDWDETYASWHVVRPFVGALVGMVAVLIVMSGILAIGADPTPGTVAATDEVDAVDAGAAPPTDIFYFLVAFLVGYREQHFREMIKRLGDVIFTSKSPEVVPTIGDIAPSTGPAGTEVTIPGTGFDEVETVAFGDVYAKFRVTSAQQIVAVAPVGPTGQVPIVVATSGGKATGQTFLYT